MKILTKVAKGIAYGDVSNSAVRNVLTEISKQVFGKITEQDMIDALDYFGWKCPYTNRDLREDLKNETGNYAVDHIVPQNREYCGLNVKGNLVVVDKKANSAKKSQTVENFLLNDEKVLHGVPKKERQQRLEKIKKFQKEYGYDPDSIRKCLIPYLETIYDETRVEQEKRIDEAINAAGLTKLTPVVKPLKGGPKSSKAGTILVFVPANENEFKNKLLANKYANITLIYDSGRTETRQWNANNFDISSSLRGNIQSKPFWRNKGREGLVKVIVETK